MTYAAEALRSKANDLERQAREARAEAARLDRQAEDARRAAAAKTPVDRDDVKISGGGAVPSDGSHRKLGPGGQQQGYVVLSDRERAKGFVRPYRDAYRHVGTAQQRRCNSITTMSRDIAETYARDPTFYSGTFCTHCRAHFPIGEDGEFTWYEMDGREGPRVGT